MTTFQARPPSDGLLEVEEAQERVLREVEVLGVESVRFDEAYGRVIREDVLAPHDAPAADNSAMDGYAVRAVDVGGASRDTPAVLEVVGDIPAGTVSRDRVEAGTAIRIMTGAFVPAGADAVVQVELTDAGRERVTVFGEVRAGANVRRRGEDLRAGSTVLRAGAVVGAAEIALLASLRKMAVSVGKCPRVAIFSTGDELTTVDAPPADGKIVSTNGHALATLVRRAGGVPRDLGIVRDTLEATVAAFRRAQDADFVISSGGVSVGAYDFVKEALDHLGAETRFWKVAMKPGKPVVLSKLGRALVFGLPGNPVSCAVAFELFVGPAIRKATGQTASLFPPVVKARLSAPLKGGDRRIYYRARLLSRAGELIVEPLRAQGSGSLSSIVGANALVQIDRGSSAEAGALVRALLIGPLMTE